MRVLVVNSPLPNLHILDANDRDQMTNVSDLIRLGHEVRLFTRISPYTTLDDCREFYQEQGIDARLIPWQTRKMLPYWIRDVAFVNGISWEFGKPDFLDALAQELTTWKPDVVWCHTGYAWPAAAFVMKRGIPAIIRSIDYVPANYTLRNQRDLRGYLPMKMLRYWGVLLGEYRSLQNAAVQVAITPVEQKLYQKLRPKSNVQVLPLKVLLQLVKKEPRQATNRHPLRVYFMRLFSVCVNCVPAPLSSISWEKGFHLKSWLKRRPV